MDTIATRQHVVVVAGKAGPDVNDGHELVATSRVRMCVHPGVSSVVSLVVETWDCVCPEQRCYGICVSAVRAVSISVAPSSLPAPPVVLVEGVSILAGWRGAY